MSMSAFISNHLWFRRCTDVLFGTPIGVWNTLEQYGTHLYRVPHGVPGVFRVVFL